MCPKWIEASLVKSRLQESTNVNENEQPDFDETDEQQTDLEDENKTNNSPSLEEDVEMDPDD